MTDGLQQAARPTTTGRVQALWLRPASRAPLRAVPQATARPGGGLDGDHAAPGKREVTLLDAGAWAAACAELGRQLDPAARRANVLVAGLDLATTLGRSLRIGEVVLDVLGETRPCELLDDGGRVGLCHSLRPQRRGGVHARVRHGGTLRVGDEVSVEPPALTGAAVPGPAAPRLRPPPRVPPP